MRFCNFHRFNGNFAGQINSILGKLSCMMLWVVAFLKLSSTGNGSCVWFEQSGTALASGRFFGYDSRVA
jgi:hypothetical protein